MPNINTSASSNMMNSSAAELMTKTDSLETGKIVVALRAARAAAEVGKHRRTGTTKLLAIKVV